MGLVLSELGSSAVEEERNRQHKVIRAALGDNVTRLPVSAHVVKHGISGRGSSFLS